MNIIPCTLHVLCPVVDSASNRNEYQGYLLCGKGGRCVRLTTLPPSCTDCLEILEISSPGALRACPGLCRDCFTLSSVCCICMYIGGLAAQQISRSSLVAAIRLKFKYISCSTNVMQVSVSPQKIVRCP
jgi:hypothetical protein